MPGAGGALIPGEEEEEGGVRLVGESLVPVGCSPGASRHPPPSASESFPAESDPTGDTDPQ